MRAGDVVRRKGENDRCWIVLRVRSDHKGLWLNLDDDECPEIIRNEVWHSASQFEVINEKQSL